MNRRHFVAGTAAFALGTRGANAALTDPGPNPFFQSSLRERLQTRAEISTYAETSTNSDVEKFIEALDLRGAPIQRGLLGVSAHGRGIPYLVSSRPVLLSGDAARAIKKPVVFVVANSHASEPDGKEAILAVLRDLALSTDHTILEDMVLVIVPNLNVDGNAAIQSASISAPTLNGPPRVGAARDAAGVDLATDFMKLESNAVSQLVDLIKFWDPDVYIDLQTYASSYSAYSLTYAPPLHPAAFYGGPYARDVMLPVLRASLKDKFGIEAFTAGGFGKSGFLGSPTPGTDLGWYAPSDDASRASNYVGIRGGTAMTAFASPYDTFERRVFNLRAFLEVALQYCSDRSDELISRTRLAAHWSTGAIPVRTVRDRRASSKELISWQQPVVDNTPKNAQQGLPAGLTLAGSFETSTTPVFDRYVGSVYAQQPVAYVVDASRAPAARRLLARHGVRFSVNGAAKTYDGETYTISRVSRAPRSDGVLVTSVAGSWATGTFAMPAGSLVVIGQQPLGPLASLLLEPESEDGLIALGAFDGTLAAGGTHPVHRVSSP